MARKLYLPIAIFFTLAICFGSLVSTKTSLPLDVHFFDKIVHICGYGVLTLSWLLAFKNTATKLKHSILLLALVFIYGIILEVLQGALTASRQSDPVDIFANLVGILLSFIFFKLVFKKNI